MKNQAISLFLLAFAVEVVAAEPPPSNITVADFPRTPPEVLTRLYEQVALIHRVCAQQKIKYWLIGGSLLGQVRGQLLSGKGEIIQWDDDADVGIDIRDKDRLLKALNDEARKVEMTVWHSTHGLKLKCQKRVGVGTDIFFYQKEEAKWVLAMEASRQAWPKDYFLKEEIETLNLVKFGPIEALIPSNPMRYLTTLYGADCMKVAVLSFNHLENRQHDGSGIKVPLCNDTKPE